MTNKTKVEEWKEIPDCKNYEVNKLGQIRNRRTEKLLTLHVNSSGHTLVSIYSDHSVNRTSVYPHVLVKKLFGVVLEATRPARRKWQRVVVGPDYNGTTRRKLSNIDIEQVKTLLRGGNITQGVIAQMFGVGQSTVSDIKCGISWKHLGKEKQKT